MDSLMNSQILTTQNGNAMSQAKKDGSGTQKFIEATILLNNKIQSDIENMSENARRSLVHNLKMLEAEPKWSKMRDSLVEICKVDRGGKLFDFADAWFNLIQIHPDEKIVELFVIRMLKFVLEIFMTDDVSVPNFFAIFNDLNIQLSKLSKNGLINIVNHVTSTLKNENFEIKKENTRGNSKFNQRWKDCVSLLIKKISEVEGNIEYEEQELNGIETSRKVLFNWMRIAENEDAFELLADISTSYSFTIKVFEKFCDDVIAEEITVDLECDDIESEKKRRAELTWKAVVLTTKAEKERLHRLWNAVITAWNIADDIEIDINADVSEGLLKCWKISQKVLRTCVESSKKFLSLQKTEKFRILTSEFSFGLAIIQCCMDRNDSLAEMKKTLQKLWRIGEQAEETVWMSEIVCGRVIHVVDSKLRNIAASMAKNEELRKVMSKPMFSLMLSLLDTPAYQKQVTIVNGRVADGCALWLLSRDILIMSCLSQSNMASQLSHLFQAIASASNNNSALILIDVLRELVKKCSVEILNNSKLIDGLFDYVCRMRRDIAISLIRCLLPIINTRPQLRLALFNSLKKDMLCESTVCSAVPIVLMLLKSVSKRRQDGGGGQFDHSMSQSFGSFSTQTLNVMGCKKNVDQSVGLELVGIVKRCLWQPASTKIVLYDGICELATQTTTMLNQFLDMLVSHAETATPEWTVSEMVISNRSTVQLKEPLPHLIQTIECVMSELSAFDPDFKLEGTEVLLKRSVELMDKWVTHATRKDISDLGFDRTIEWTNTNNNGKCSIVFAQMMMSTYDVLIEHVWRRIDALDRKDDADKMVALLKRRKELGKMLKEKTSGKKALVDETITETSNEIVLTSAKTLSSIMVKLMENGDADTTNNTTLNVRREILADVQMELLTWVIGRAKVLSSAIVKEYRPLHSIVSGTNSLMLLSKCLLEFFIGNHTPNWIEEIETGTAIKLAAIESYANILQFLTMKYKSAPERVTIMWFEEKEGESDEEKRKRQDPQLLVLRHSYFLGCRLFRQVLSAENDEIEGEKKEKIIFESQGKHILRAALHVLNMSKNVKVWTNIFKRAAKLLEEEVFYNNQMLRDFTKFVNVCALRCGESDKLVMTEMTAIFENVLDFLSEDDGDEGSKYKFITKTSLNVTIEFMFNFVEKTLAHIKEAFVFLKDFCVKPPVFDGILEALMIKCTDITELVSRVLQLFVQYKLMQERVTEIMTAYFSTIQMSVVLLQNLTKLWSSEMREWKSVDCLATLIKTKLAPILAMVDDKIGYSKGKDEMKRKISQKTRLQKSLRDEKLYVKFSLEREAVQHNILVLCKLIKDDRFDLQIKNNSVGYRDFRIDMDLIRSKLGVEENTSTSRKRRRDDTEDNESDDNDEDDVTENQEGMMTEGEESRDVPDSREVGRGNDKSAVQVKEEEEDVSRGVSPVF